MAFAHRQLLSHRIRVVAAGVVKDADAEMCSGAEGIFASLVNIISITDAQPTDAVPIGDALREKAGAEVVVAAAIDQGAKTSG